LGLERVGGEGVLVAEGEGVALRESVVVVSVRGEGEFSRDGRRLWRSTILWRGRLGR